MSTCWPARCPGQSGASRTSVFTWGVSSTTSATSQSCHVSGFSRPTTAAPPTAPPGPLLPPRVSIHVVPQRLPEARLVAVGESEPAHPLRALPEVEVGDEQGGAPAWLGIERFVVVAERDPGLAVGHVFERQVRRIAAVAERDHVRRVVLD